MRHVEARSVIREEIGLRRAGRRLVDQELMLAIRFVMVQLRPVRGSITTSAISSRQAAGSSTPEPIRVTA